MYRDDEEAADALARKLRRDNEDLAAENARLKAQLAAASTPTKAKKQQKKNAKKATASTPTRPREAPRMSATDIAIHVVVGLTVGALAGYASGYLLNPVFNRGATSLPTAIGVALVAQVGIFVFVAPAFTGRWDHDWAVRDESEDGRLRLPRRAVMLAAGLALVAFTAFLGALPVSGD